jgi:uncharacterized membrane protein
MEETVKLAPEALANPTLLDALQLSPFGLMHTIISLIALAAGVAELARHRDIHPSRFLGTVFVAATIGACLTGFGIFRHGGFGTAHLFGVFTLLVLGLAVLAGKTNVFGSASRKVEMLSYSGTFVLHFIPAFTETATRLPVGNPLVADRDGIVPKAASAVFFALYLAFAWYQLKRLRENGGSVPAE